MTTSRRRLRLPRRLVTAAASASAAVLLICGCSAMDASGSGRAMPTDTGVDYQLGGASTPPDGVGIVARDSTAEPAVGIWSICYVNGFQTQPGEEARWSTAGTDLLLSGEDGLPLVDPGWPDESILDTSTEDRRQRILAEMTVDIERCAASGFDAVEIDNLDTYTRFPDRLDREGAVALAGSYAELVHGLGMSIGQKNAAEDAERLREEVGFDFAVAEECVAYEECGRYTAVYGDQVVDIEYIDDVPALERPAFVEAVCDDPQRPSSLVIRDRDLRPAGAEGWFRASC